MSKQLPHYVGLAVLFVVCFLVLNWLYGYVILVQSETTDCFFMFGREFAVDLLDRPAAPLTYAGRFLGQFYLYPWLGALIVSGGITCFGLVFHAVLVKLQGTAHVFMTLIPCILLLALHTSTACLIQDTLGVSASCSAFFGYLLLRRGLTRHVYALAATPLLYLGLGAYVWLFVVCVVAFEWLDGPAHSGLGFKIFYITFSLAVPLAAWRWLFLLPLRSTVEWPIAFTTRFRGGVPYGNPANLYLDCFLAALFFISVLLILFSHRLSIVARISTLWRANCHKWNHLGTAAVVLVLAVLFHLIRYDAALARGIVCRQLYKHKRWDALLENARKDPSATLELQFMTNFALEQKGRLLDEMFHYPQEWGRRGLVLNFSSQSNTDQAENDKYRAMFNSDLFYELGHVNLAFRHAFDTMILIGETDTTLKRIVQCSLANGNHGMADKYLRRLERTLFHRDFARRYRAIMADPEAVEREFADIRKRMPVIDLARQVHPMQHVAILMQNSDNIMAFNYLNAWLLLDKQKASISTMAANIERFRLAEYASIPTHCQEVLVLWERQEGVSVDLRGFRYDGMITARVDEFLRDLALNQNRPDGSLRLGQRYGDTYMYYCYCVHSPEEMRRLAPPGSGSASTFREE